MSPQKSNQHNHNSNSTMSAITADKYYTEVTSSAPAPHEVEISTSGCLFDLDGTLMLSTDCVEAFWRDFGATNDIDAEELLRTSHGRRTLDILRMWKPEYANKEMSAKFEATIPQRWKHMAKPVPGVHKFLSELPPSQWGIVTSGTTVMATSWLQDFLEITPPEIFVTAEHIVEGKPHPEGYMKGHKDLDLAHHFLVFEDAPAGIRAGKDAGAFVIGMATTYDADKVKAAGADIVIPDLTHIRVKSWDAEKQVLKLAITNPL